MDIDFTDNSIKINLRAEPVAPPLSNQDLKTCQLSLPARWKINEREKCEHRRRERSVNMEGKQNLPNRVTGGIEV